MQHCDELLNRILNIGLSLSVEQDRGKLLSYILQYSMEISHADAGTLYILKDGYLHFCIVKTISVGEEHVFAPSDAACPFPARPLTEDHICSYCALHREILNIPDVYHTDAFDFSGSKMADAEAGYHTQSMLVLPLIDQDGNVLGVLQLINAQDENGTIIPFEDGIINILRSLASQASITLSNMQYKEDLQNQMWSFTEALTEAVDQRTPYNASHSRNVAKFVGMMADVINRLHDEGKISDYFSKQRRESLLMGAYLHDIGKMAIPTSIMNKSKRLGHDTSEIKKRLDVIALHAQIDLLEGAITKEAYEAELAREQHVLSLATQANDAGYLEDALYEKVLSILDMQYVSADGTGFPYFTYTEKKYLTIRKGTLTEQERAIMADHARITKRILSKVEFGDYFANSPIWAAQHHELLDGSGYPEHLTKEKLALESRMMAVADICDALLASDRPYKKPMSKEKAFAIMHDMAAQGKIEDRLVSYLEEALTQEEKMNS